VNGTLLLAVTAFLASAVEMVEAVTIILAVGLTRGWRAALVGTAAGLLVLTVVVAALGPTLVRLVPLEALQLVIGALLLIFGLQWLRKAILRAAGRKALHDEDAIFQEEIDELSGAPVGAGFDWLGFTVAFKGVFLEGLEVAFIVLTFGLNAGQFGPSAVGALAALVVVVLVAVVVHRPLSRVPENAIKFAVGIALTTFGTFWSGEGVGLEWPLGDATLLVLLVAYSALAFVLVSVAKLNAQGRLQTAAERTLP
jgi:uncharacterized membrane protein